MRKIKKHILVVSLAMIISAICFSGCSGVSPCAVEKWYLTDIETNGELVKVGPDTNGDSRLVGVFSDSVTFSFKEDKTFVMTTSNGETQSGTYTAKRDDPRPMALFGDSALTLTFSDNTKGIGTISRVGGLNYFYYSGSVTVGDTTYFLGEYNDYGEAAWNNKTDAEE